MRVNTDSVVEGRYPGRAAPSGALTGCTFRAVGGQLGQHRGGQDPATEHHPRRRRGHRLAPRWGAGGVVFAGGLRVGAGGEGGGFGEHVDHHRLRARVGVTAGGAVRRVAATAQLGGPGGQRAQRVRAALSSAARVLLAHPVNHLGQPPLPQGGVGRSQPTPQRGGAGHVVAVSDADVATARGDAGAPARTGMVAFHQRVNGLFELVRR